MEIYLPIAEMSVHWLVILGMGASVGFLAGMFGVSGGFLLTPLLIFYGIPPGVAVATTASHMTASAMSGALTQWRHRAVDLRMALVMITGGLAGTELGVFLFGLMRRAGQIELTVSLAYVVLLGVIGALMLNEAARTLLASRAGKDVSGRKPGQHNWIHGLPLKMRFRESRLYISIIPPAVLGVIAGIMSAIMGVGGGFMLVPAMIYILRMPTNVVLGTSLLQILFVTIATTVLHSVSDFSVDIVLAGLLILGGVVGTQFGLRVGAKLRGEELRLLLALLVLAVAIRLLIGLIATPDDLYSVAVGKI
jgi:uncharacterized membrane protein YfcA